MEIIITQGDITTTEAPAIFVNLFQDGGKLSGAISAINKVTNNRITREIKENDFEGKFLESLVIYAPSGVKAKYVIVMGLGKEDAFNPTSLRKITAKSIQKARELRISTIAIAVHGMDKLSVSMASQVLTEGALLGNYQFNKYKTESKAKQEANVQTLQVYEPEKEKITTIRHGVTRGQAIAEAIIKVRNIINEPPTKVKPRTLAEYGQDIATSSESIVLQLHDRYDLTKQNYTALLAVSSGSEEEPYLIHLHYKPATVKNKSIAFIGKGVTFDSGGLGIKPWSAMRTMKTDMAGAGTVLGIFQALAYLESVGMPIEIEVHGIIPTTENMISGKAMRPDDIIETKSGKTIEIAHTDAEGRLILSDALTFANLLKPDYMVDFATLTGAAIRALGRSMSAYMGTDATLLEMVKQASEATGELAWELPLHEPYREYLKSDIADMQNIGKSEHSPDAIIGGLFLKEFTDAIPWCHIDIAGPSWQEEENHPVYPKGATGYGILLGINILEQLTS